ncbi:MAG: hypothetical protein QXG00_04450 [Candidatus Woesearchaeota archaeon]
MYSQITPVWIILFNGQHECPFTRNRLTVHANKIVSEPAIKRNERNIFITTRTVPFMREIKFLWK